MVKELGIPWPFTDFETSGFWGRGGKLITEVRGPLPATCALHGGVPVLVKCKPVLCSARAPSAYASPMHLPLPVRQAPVFSKLPRLPAILGQFVHTAPLFSE